MTRMVRDEAERGGRREGLQRSQGLGSVWGCRAARKVRAGEGWSALLLQAGSPDRISATARLTLLPEVSPGIKEPPFQPIVGHFRSLGLSPGLYRLHPHPLSPPLRWRSCWHWMRSGRSPSAPLLSGLLSPLCHRQHPISQHPLRAPPGPKPPSSALPAQGGLPTACPASLWLLYNSLGL